MLNQHHRRPLFFRAAAFAWLLATLCGVGYPSAAGAGEHGEAKISLHLAPVEGRRDLCGSLNVQDPMKFQVSGDLDREYLVYVLLTDFDTASGVTGVQFGIQFEDSTDIGVDVLRWRRCATLEFPSAGWPHSGSGNLLTWVQTGDCQRDTPLVIGMFRARAATPGSLTLVPRQVDNLAAVAGCGGPAESIHERIDHLPGKNLGRVDFGGGPGYNPNLPGEFPPD